MLAEIANYLSELDALRAKVLKTLDGLDAHALNWTPTDDETNSLYVIATHALGSEHGWIYEGVGGGEKTRVRSEEFKATADNLDSLRARYARVASESKAVLEGRTEQDLAATHVQGDHGAVSERWMVLHVISHYAEHIGQMYLTRQLWEGKQKGGE